MDDNICQHVRELLLFELGCDRALRDRLAEALRHLAECPDCRAAIEQFEGVGGGLRLQDSAEGAPAGGWAAFENRLEQSVRDAATDLRSAPALSQGKASLGHGVRPGWLRPAAAMAAALIIGISGFTLGRVQRGQIPSTGENGLSSVAAAQPVPPPTSQDVASRVRAFVEVDRVFDGRADWLLLSGGDPQFGLSQSPEPGAHTGRRADLMLVRLTLLRQGQTVSSADVVIVAGGEATLRLNGSVGPSVRYRLVRPVEDPAALTLRAQLGPDNQPDAALATRVTLAPGRVISAGQLVTPAGAYDLRVSLASAPVPAPVPERVQEPL